MRIPTEVTLSNSKEAQTRAEASFKRKQDQARDGAKAWAEYEAQRRGIDEAAPGSRAAGTGVRRRPTLADGQAGHGAGAGAGFDHENTTVGVAADG